MDSKVWLLLDKGRNKTTSFDLKNAPLSLFVYSCCSLDHLNVLIPLAQQMFKDQLTPYEFLSHIPDYLRRSIAHALSQMILSRKALFDELCF